MNSSGDVGLLPQAAGIAHSPSFPSPSQVPPKTMIINPSSSTNNDLQNALVDASNVKWTKVNDAATSQSIQPRPRHGHRAVAYGNYMIVFGGGNEGIVEELHVFDTSTHEWFQPQMKGEIPPGCAAYGLVLDGCRMLLYGGMIEYGRYSSDLYELNIAKWEWKKLKPKPPRNGSPPCARLGHSFTIFRDQVYLFGGLANDSDDLKNNIPRYLNDMYTLQVRLNNEHGAWDIPVTFGSPPGPRESHTAVAYVSKDQRFNKLIVYGGMSGCRLGDLYVLDVDTLMWCKPEVGGATPSPRSLHTATLVGEKMYVFGGWVPMMVEELKNSEKEWKCTNSLACLNVETLTWENLHQDILDEKVPRARAGHSAVVINTRIYIWSGRDGYRKAWNNQVCCKDLWQLEVQKPGDPGKVQLLRAGTNWLEVGWNPVPGADSYILQCVAYEVSEAQSSESNSAQPLQSLAAAGYAPTPPIMTPVPTSKPAKSAVPPVKETTPPAAPIAAPSLPSPAQLISAIGATPTGTPVQIVTSMPTVVSQASQPPVSLQVAASVQQQLPDGAATPGASSITLSMPSLSGSPSAGVPADASVVAAAAAAAQQAAVSSVGPASLPAASSLYTLPANVAGTASAMLASKTVTRPISTTIASPQGAGRGVLRLRTPIQQQQPRAPGTVVTTLPAGAILKTPASTSADASSAQLSGMHALAAAAASTQKMQTPQAQTVKVVQQSAGQTPVYGQVKVANLPGGVLPTTVRIASPNTGKPAVAGTGSPVRQIVVPKPGTPGTGNQIYTVVKTSQGMALANIQGSKVIQGKPGVSTTNVVPVSSIQGSPQKTANIIKWVAAPGSGVATGSRPNIIATNQTLLGLAGQGATSSAPKPTYIISKPATTMANRPQAPQYVVVTQASAIRGLQGMTTSTIGGGQTITLPTSAAGGNPQGVKMIVMPSGSTAGAAGQAVKIITPGGVQTSAVPKPMTLTTSKPAQYITSTGQIVTLPPGLLQSGSQQINIGGKQVTLQMAGGQKLAILSNSGGQLVQSSQSPGDAGKPRFVMVGQKPGLPTSTPMRISLSGIVPQSEASSSSTSLSQDGVGTAAEGLVDLATATMEPQVPVVMDQQGLNGMDGDQSGGLKGGCIYTPDTPFSFSGMPWMKLKGGSDEFTDDYIPRRDSTIPIYSVNTKFSWRHALGFGLKGGAGETGDGVGVADSQTQDQSAPIEEETQRIEEAETTSGDTQDITSTSMEMDTDEQGQDSSATTLSDANTQAIENLAEFATQDVSDVSAADTQLMDTQQEETAAAAVAGETAVAPGVNAETVDSSAETQLLDPSKVTSDESAIASDEQQGQVPTTSEESGISTSLASSITFSLDAPTPVILPNSSTGTPIIPLTTAAALSSTDEMVMSFSIPTQSLEDQQQQQPTTTDQISQSTIQILAQQAAAAQPVLQDQPISQLTFTTQAGTQQLVIQQQPQQQAVSQQQSNLQQATPVTAQVVSQPQPALTQSTPVVPSPQPTPPASTPVTQFLLPVGATGTPIVSQNAVPQSIASLVSGVSMSGTQTPIVIQSPSSSVASSTPILLPTGLSVSLATSSVGTIISAAAAGMMSQQSPNVSRVTVSNATPIIRTQVSNMSQMPISSATNGSIGPSPVVVSQATKPSPAPLEEKIENWMDVIHTKTTSHLVKCYFTTNEKLSKLDADVPVDKDLEFIKKKIELKPATAYKFRVAAINSCGRGPWSEVTAFKTCLPGFPGAPSSIKISKSIDGATIAWEPPLNTPGDILEYSVYLAVKPPANAPPKPGVTNLSFVRVYCGPSNQCNVPTASLHQALVDTTSKPAIIFRIAAKNDKGYGPATQVRWLQESALPNFVQQKSALLKRQAPYTATAAAGKRTRDGN